MNTEIKQIGLGIAGAMVVRGVGGVFPSTASPKLVNGALALASGVGAWKVKDPNLKAALMGGALIKGVDFIKSIFEGTTTAVNLQAKTDKASLFLKSATGLGCPMDGLNGAEEEAYLLGGEQVFVDEEGNVIGLHGGEQVFTDEEGNVIGLGYADEDSYEMLNGEDIEEQAHLMGDASETDYL